MMADANPSLFIVGHPKTGTTALHAFLSEHPSICMSRPKEPWFFCSDFHRQSDEYHGRPLFFRFRDQARYHRVFSHAGSEPVLGEASAVYLHSLTSAAEIARFNPEAKIVILLREPVAFLRALHKEFLRNAMEDEPDFATAISKDGDRKRGRHLPAAIPCPSWSLYCDWVDYARQIGRFFDEFGRSRVQVLLSEDFRSDNPAVYKQVVRFIGVDDGFVPEFRQLNDRGMVTLSWIGRLLFNPRLRWISQRILPYRVYSLAIDIARRASWKDATEDNAIPAALVIDLRSRFQPCIEEVSQMLGRDLWAYWSEGSRSSPAGARPWTGQ